MTWRLGTQEGRAVLLLTDAVIDVERRSGGRFPADPMAALAGWSDFAAWADSVADGEGDGPLDESRLGPPVPRPQKVFGIGLNYAGHAAESGATAPDRPQVFTKFPSCLTGPGAEVMLPSDSCDWEVELVVVVGRGGSRIAEAGALDHVAGYLVGQDISERRVQLAGDRPQFSLGKSFDTFGPTGPGVTPLSAFADPGDLGISCSVSGEVVQESRTADLIFSVPALVSYISGICTLQPGDLIFTGTPSGVGMARRPPRFLTDGDVITSSIEGVGTITNRCVRRAD